MTKASESDPNLDAMIVFIDEVQPSVNEIYKEAVKQMLPHAKEILEYHEGLIAINPVHDKHITSLRTAVEKGEGSLDKEATSFDDCFDSFRLSLMFWH
jgi:hypothetical protein